MNDFPNKDKSILVVDDIVDNLRLVSSMLKNAGYKVRCTKSGKIALQAIQEKLPDLILLDIQMPEMDGFEICERLKNDERTSNIPVIFLSASDSIDSKIKGFQLGGVDYITKPFHMEEVLIRVNNHLLLRSANNEITELNKLLQEQFVIQKAKNLELEEINTKLKQEIVARQKAEEQLVHDALHDSLTKLPNRAFLLNKINHSIKVFRRNPQALFSLLFIDLNKFKVVNDTLGHSIGDQLLIEVAKMLRQNIREIDTVARLGGDEFIILLEQLDDPSSTKVVAERLLKAIQRPFLIDGNSISIGASIGIVHGSCNYSSSSQILRDADIAMYQAKTRSKAKRKNCFEVFDDAMYLQTVKINELERDLRGAIDNQEFYLNYQPIISLKENNLNLEGFEALVRWNHPREGFISPGEFIPIAEETGLIVPLGDWILREACQQLANWQKQFSDFPGSDNWKISINVSSQQFQELDFIEKLESVIFQTQLLPSSIKLEITERILIESEVTTQNNLSAIQKSDIKLSIDDFGTGYSSFSYLQRLPIDNLKIDRSFIEDVNSNQENLEIVKTIIALAHTLGMDTIAEGIETSEQAQVLAKLNCDMAQGYYFAKPLSVVELESWITKNTPVVA